MTSVVFLISASIKFLDISADMGDAPLMDKCLRWQDRKAWLGVDICLANLLHTGERYSQSAFAAPVNQKTLPNAKWCRKKYQHRGEAGLRKQLQTKKKHQSGVQESKRCKVTKVNRKS